MCGIAGTMKPNMMPDLMELAARRGPHAWGISDKIRNVHEKGAFKRSIFPHIFRYKADPGLEYADKMLPLIGHCRMASDGYYDDYRRTQPLTTSNHLENTLGIVHNGVIHDLAGIDSVSDTRMFLDSFGSDYEFMSRTPLYKLFMVALKKYGVKRYAIAITDWQTIVVAANGLPLFVQPETASFCSLDPGGWQRVDNHGFHVWKVSDHV